MIRRHFKKLDKLLLLVIVIISVVLRTMGARFGLPYKWHGDEAKMFWYAHQMILNRTAIPEMFRIGSPTIYLESILMLLLGYGSRLLVSLGCNVQTVIQIAQAFGQDTPAWPISNQFINYSLYLGRITVGFLAGISSLVVYMIAVEVFRRRSVGLLAAATNAILYIQIQHSWILRMMNLGYLFVGLTMLLALHYYRIGSRRALLICGLIAGTTVSIKYNLAPVVVTPLAAYYLRGREGRQEKSVDRNGYPNWVIPGLKALLALMCIGWMYSLIITAATPSDPSHAIFFGRYSLERLRAMILLSGMLALAVGLLLWSSLLTRLSDFVLGKRPQLAYLFAGLIISGLLFNLGLLFRTPEYVRQVLFQSGVYFGGEYKGSIPSGLNILYRIGEYFYLEGLGPIFFLFSVIGFIRLLKFTGQTMLDIHRKLILLSFPLAYLLLYSFTHIFVLRNYLPLSIFFALFSAYGCIELSQFVAGFLHQRTSQDLLRRFASVVLVLIAYAGGSIHHVSLIAKMLPTVMSPDTRTEALSWLTSQADLESAIILLDSDLYFSPIELKSVGSHYVLLPITLDSRSLLKYKDMGVEVIVTSLYKLDKLRDKEIKLQTPQPIFRYADLYRQRVRKESKIELRPEASMHLLQLAQFTKPEHQGPRGTDFEELYTPGVVIRTDTPGSVPVILNPDIVVYRLR